MKNNYLLWYEEIMNKMLKKESFGWESQLVDYLPTIHKALGLSLDPA